MAKGRMTTLTVDVPAREVTLLEDRARVVRRATVTLPAGMIRVRVGGVAPILADKTLTGSIVAGSGSTGSGSTGSGADRAKIADIRVVREHVIGYDESQGSPDAQAAELDKELRELDARIEHLETERVTTERHASGLDKVTMATLTELSEDVSFGKNVAAEDWQQKLAQLATAERNMRERLVEIASEIEDLRRRRQHLDERIVKTQNPIEREWASLEADISVTRAGDFEMVLEYVVPNACWRPYHTARLLLAESATGGAPESDPGRVDDAARVLFTTDACVWQNTGEDWNEVQLVLSTERASLGTEPPSLYSDVLVTQRKSEQVVVETREKEIQHLGPGVDDNRSVTSPDLPGIDDGGVALNLRAERLSSVPANGRPYRIKIGEFSAAADVELTAMPELMDCVLQKSVQENRGTGPILAGPVDLIRDSGLVGRTSVLFVAAGERFELGWGPEPDLRIKRDTDVTEEKSRMLSSWITRVHEIEIRMSNLGDRTHSVKVSERIPVSEIDKVKITQDRGETTAGQQADENGFVNWNVTLSGGSHERLQLSYKLERQEDVRGI